MNEELQNQTSSKSSISKLISHFLDQRKPDCAIESIIIQRKPEEILEALFDYELISEVLPQLKDVSSSDGEMATLSFQVAGDVMPGFSISLKRDETKGARWDFNHPSGNFAGTIFLDELPLDGGTFVSFLSESTNQKDSILDSIRGFFTHDDQQTLHDGLRRFKSLLESGQIATTVGQPRGLN